MEMVSRSRVHQSISTLAYSDSSICLCDTIDFRKFVSTMLRSSYVLDRIPGAVDGLLNFFFGLNDLGLI